MDFDDYQRKAVLTDQFRSKTADDALMIPLLGVAGETGTLLAEFKKKIRDKDSYEGFTERAKEELGDILWYLANLASRLGLSLSEIAAANLRKTQERWPIPGEPNDTRNALDGVYPESERLPRTLRVRIVDDANGKVARLELLPDGIPLGDELSNNAYDDDGYRFHDVFHFAHMAVLGWSPVLRRLLGRKRKSNPTVDEVEDGARANILEELIVAFVYSNARERKFYDGIAHLDTDTLSTIKRLVAGLEVRVRPAKQWEAAILQGYAAFRYLLEHRRAILIADLDSGRLSFEQCR
jgi:NTP pyrophosphatase (non-canonical NTP hydrolase)